MILLCFGLLVFYIWGWKAGQLSIRISDKWIKEVAAHNWIMAGRPSGRDKEFWYQAKSDLLEREFSCWLRK